ncbi:MAG: ubiquinone/menaquinone biosynthesis methyltransferase [Bdellovibrionota bacterium]|jgi:demethylmenaquinone methyltransferase/2-methoxy-6-polyprenyl-1,4-benzoquinol methylase
MEYPQVKIQVVGKEVQEMFGSIAERYDIANSCLSLGIHKWWRRQLSRAWRRLSVSGPILDLCSGTGDILFELEKTFPHCIGADFCLPMLEQGKKRKESSTFLQADALKLPFLDETFALITVSFGVRNLEKLELGLQEMFRVLKPGGHLLVMEFGQPRNRAWRALFSLYSFQIMPFLGGLLTGNRAAYEYLPRTSQKFPCGKAFIDQLKVAGFSSCTAQSLSGGVAYIYYGQK